MRDVPAVPERKPSRHEILVLALPAMGSLAAEPLLGLVDTAFLGRVGPVALAALGAANALIGLLISTLVFLEYGTTARLARRLGGGEGELLTREAVQMGWLATLLGIPITAAFILFPGVLLRLTQVPAEVREVGATYLRIRGIAAIPALWMLSGHGIFRGLQDTRSPLLVVAGMNILNAALDLPLIFGWPLLGIPPLGVAGAAVASATASWCGGLSFLWLLGRRLRFGRGTIREGLRFHWKTLRDLLGLCRDLLLRTLALRAALFSGTRAAAAFGIAALAAHQVAWQLWMFLALVLDSLAIAGQALIGRELGAGRPAAARAIGNQLNRWGLLLGTFLALLFFVLRSALPRLFTHDPAVLLAIGRVFPIIALMQIPNAILFVLDGLLIGASDTVFLRNSMIALGLFGVLTAWLGGVLGGSLTGVWIGIGVFMLARLVVMGARWAGSAWEK